MAAAVAVTGGARCAASWQPTHESVSPGMAVNQLRINCRALPVFVQRLDGDRRVGRHAEHRRAVRVDRHGAQHAQRRPTGRPCRPMPMPAHAVVAESGSVNRRSLLTVPRGTPSSPGRGRRRQVDDRVLALRVDACRGSPAASASCAAAPARAARSPAPRATAACCRIRRPDRCPRASCGVGLQATRKYLSLSGQGWRNLGQLPSTRLSTMIGSTCLPRPGIRWTTPSASNMLRLRSNRIISPMGGTS